MSVKHVKLILQWDQRELGSAVVGIEALDMEQWLTSTVRLAREPTIPSGLSLPIYEQTLIQVRLEAVDSIGRRLHSALGR